MSDDLFQGPIDHYIGELRSFRAGRATPDLVNELPVEVYGQKMPMQQLATISTIDNLTLQIQPWDKASIKAVEKAIHESLLGLTPIVDGVTIRVALPKLTEEQRHEYVKLIGKKEEEAKIALRKIREEELKQAKARQKEGAITEDELERTAKNVQQELDAATRHLEELTEHKQKELLTV